MKNTVINISILNYDNYMLLRLELYETSCLVQFMINHEQFLFFHNW